MTRNGGEVFQDESGGNIFDRCECDGSDAHNITDNPAFEGWPAWSPDGSKIAFASNRGNQNYQIDTMNPDGSGVELVAATEARATAPKWSQMEGLSCSQTARKWTLGGTARFTRQS